MMLISIFMAVAVAVAVVLVLLLFLVVGSGNAEEQEVAASEEQTQNGSRFELEQIEFAGRIFSRQDRDYILQIGSPRLLKSYLEQRKKVALYWVGQTSSELTRIMIKHRLISRRAVDLDVVTETRLLLQYLRLRAIFAVLRLLLYTSSPDRLSDLASYACQLYQLVGQLLSDRAVPTNVIPPEKHAIL